jgi:thiocyanate hydrolase gamma subunit
VLETAIRELAIEKGLFTPEDHRRFMEFAQRIGPHGGSRLVARAWLDPAFKQRLLSDGTETSKEIGIDWLDPTGTGTPSDYTYFYVLENTPEVHNVIVCTLCSCYPWAMLGLPPTWYKSAPYRSRMVSEPRVVLEEFGLRLPNGTAVNVWDSSSDLRYMVLPERPEGTEGWSEQQLASIVTRDCMIGVARPQAPAEKAAR